MIGKKSAAAAYVGGVNALTVTGLLIGALGLVAPRADSADSFKCKETQTDKLVGSCNDGFDVFTTGTFGITAKVFSDTNLTANAFDPETTVNISVGDWSFSGILGDDPKYVAGAKRTTFLLTHEKCPDEGDCKTKTHGKVSLKFTAKGLLVNISAKTGYTATEDFESSGINANVHASDNTNFTDIISASISIGDLSTSTGVAVIGTAKTKTVTQCNGDVEDNLNNVKLIGAAAE
jgi:hypothetical protein